VASCCDCGNEPSGSSATELVMYSMSRTKVLCDEPVPEMDRYTPVYHTGTSFCS
jgi:hypothetical protein